MSLLWPKNGDIRGKDRNIEIYYRGEWHSKKAHETSVIGDKVVDRVVTDPDYKIALKIRKRRFR